MRNPGNYTIPIKQKIENKEDDLSVIITASSYINRMKGYGSVSSFRDSMGRSILDSQILNIKHVYPKAEIVVVVGLETDKIVSVRGNQFRVVENVLFETTNEVEDIRLGLNNITTRNVIIINADMYFNRLAISNLLQQSCLVYDTKNQLANYDIGITIIDGYASILALDLHTKWCNISFFQDGELAALRTLCTRDRNKMYLFEILNMMLDKGAKLRCLEPGGGKFFKADSLEQFRKLQTIYL